jgi:hypothetical protein
MATVPSVKILKTFPFKGGVRTWSNRYYFAGGVPADDTHWNTLFDAIVAAEKLLHSGTTTIVQANGYLAGSDVAVALKTYSTLGTTGIAANARKAPGEVAALTRLSTSARSTKNHPIYCFSYMHGVYVNDVDDSHVDLLDATQKANMLTYANAWISGFSDGTHTLTRCSPAGHLCTGAIVEEYVTHRDFPPTRSV